MNSRKLESVVATMYEAVADPNLWPVALDTLAEAVEAIGACCLILNKRSEKVDWISFSGPCAELKADYLAYYAPRDPYTPAVTELPTGKPLWLSETVAKPVLRSNEWYNDFVRKNGIHDILGGKLFQNASHAIMFGIHAGPGQSHLSPSNAARLNWLMKPLTKASWLHLQNRDGRLTSSAAIQGLRQLSVGAIITDQSGHIIDLNDVAERIIRQTGGLAIRSGRLVASRRFEATRLASIIAAAAAGNNTEAKGGRMLVGRGDGHSAYLVAVAPVRTASYDIPMAMILVSNPEWQVPTKETLEEVFGLSPAESRLAAALAEGKRMAEVATEWGVEITTLRTQLSSILGKVGAERQTDLMRIFSRIGLLAPRSR